MPVTLSKIAANTATVTLHFGEDSLNVEYHPLKISTEMMSQIQSFASTSDEMFLKKFQEVVSILVAIIKSWDLLEDDGSAPIPLTIERVMGMSPVISMLIIQAIGADLRPEMMAPQTQNSLA